MATIKTAFQLVDNMTKPIQSMIRGVDQLVSVMETAEGTFNNTFDRATLQSIKEDLAQAKAGFDQIEQEIRQADNAQEDFKRDVEATANSVNGLGAGLKGVLATVGSIATIKMGFSWANENMELANVQRNAEYQLATVLNNMGVGEVTIQVDADTTQAVSAFDAIKAKASEIQGMGIYGDESMIAGAAELSTYFTDAEAIMSMMDTLSNYAMGMSGGGALDSTAMTDYATGIGKIMSGSFDAMTKKGFEFTDAQKAVINGTATHAQYIEALGEDYKNMSEDMRAATVINDIIAESWDGLYANMSNTPEGKIIQLKNSFGDLREMLGNQVYPYVLMIADAFTQNFPQIEGILIVVTDALGNLMLILGWIAEGALNVATAISDNWGWIEPLIMGIVTALGLYYGALVITNTIMAISAGIKAVHAAASMLESGATFAATVAQYGFNAALLACPITWIILAIVALIAIIIAVMRAFDAWGSKTHSVIGMICGIFMVALAFIGNIFVAAGNLIIDVFVLIYNLVATVANFIGNVFNDPVGAVCRLFFDLADTVLSVLQALASAIDTIFGSNLAGAVQGWRDSLGGWVESTFGKGEEIMAKLDGTDMHFQRFEYEQAFNLGAEFGDGISDSIGDMFDTSAYDTSALDSYNMGNLGQNIADSSAATAANTAKTADILEDDLKTMIDLAEREAINRYTTAEIKVEQTNYNTVEQDMDIDGIMDAWAADFAERLEVSAEGVHW